MMPMAFSGNNMVPRGTGIINRMLNGIKSFNWSGLLSGANKTLNVVNQTIPLIRETKPIINNVRSIVSLTKAFGKEVNTRNTNNNSVIRDKIINNYVNTSTPTFFA